MSKSLDNALSENAWSVSAVMFDLNDMLDDEGRPISERRADVLTRKGVEMEMRLCPFGGIRQDKWMNVSALTQITHYYNDALAEMTAFRRQARHDNATWSDILACVVELLAGPAFYLLQQRNPKGPVPAKMAVGHKLAAGMFGVMRGLHERLALGADIPVTTDAFMDLIDETGALVGASEACAGSPPMIRKASAALIEGLADTSFELAPDRLERARHLALQIQLGVFWHLYDNVHLWSLLRGDFRQHLAPVNNFLERKIDHEAGNLDVNAPPRPSSTALPDELEPKVRETLAKALSDDADAETLAADMDAVTGLLGESRGAVKYNGPAEPFARSVASYLNTFRLFKAELSRVELEFRKQLGFPTETPIQLGIAAFPAPRALHWYDIILGSDHRK